MSLECVTDPVESRSWIKFDEKWSISSAAVLFHLILLWAVPSVSHERRLQPPSPVLHNAKIVLNAAC